MGEPRQRPAVAPGHGRLRPTRRRRLRRVVLRSGRGGCGGEQGVADRAGTGGREAWDVCVCVCVCVCLCLIMSILIIIILIIIIVIIIVICIVIIVNTIIITLLHVVWMLGL